MTDTLDELATAVREGACGPAVLRLWHAVYGLERWWLLPTGAAADPRPMVGVVLDRTYLLAFTSEQHVTRFAAGRGGPADGAGTAAMSITPADLTALAPALMAQGLAGVVFNHGVHGVMAPVAGLEAMWAQFGRSLGEKPR